MVHHSGTLNRFCAHSYACFVQDGQRAVSTLSTYDQIDAGNKDHVKFLNVFMLLRWTFQVICI